MALCSLVWDSSATMIEVPLENAINMHSVWTAWFQFWGKQHLLYIDVIFFHNILNVQHRIEWVQRDRLKKSIKMQQHLVIAFCAKLPNRHLQFECSVLHLNVDLYFKFDKYSKFEFFFFDSPTQYMHFVANLFIRTTKPVVRSLSFTLSYPVSLICEYTPVSVTGNTL